MERTISFVKGKGSISHNNREFITDNVDRDRIEDNIVYVQKKLVDGYDEFFEEAIKEYDEKQKRKDRQYGSVQNYITSLENSKNGEKLYYENIVQIGDMTNSGCGTPEGKVCAEILNEYALAFQERNPKLQVINMVLHMDEKTPHLHIDYVPVAIGYKQGLKVRNSLSKALENQGFSNESRNKYKNSLLSWQKHEREQIREICIQHGIDTIELGIKRDDMELEVYKEHAKLNNIKEEVKEVTVKAEQLKQQTDYYEERVAAIDEIKYGVFAGKKAEEDNKALQYDNKKLMDEKDRLQRENQELKEAAGSWKLLYQGIMTYTGDKRKKAIEMISKLMNRGKDPLQAHIDDQRLYDVIDIDTSIKRNPPRERFDQEERM